MHGKRVFTKPVTKIVGQVKPTTASSTDPVRILKRDNPMTSGPTGDSEGTQVDSGRQLLDDKASMAKAKKLMLEKMRSLSKANPDLGLEKFLWEGPSTTRPPDMHSILDNEAHQSSVDMEVTREEPMLHENSQAMTRLSQPNAPKQF